MAAPQYKQGDVVYLYNPLTMPKGEPLEHPIFIISSNTSNAYENRYTGIMMSATSLKDKFSFMLENSMFERPLKPNSQLRLYLVFSFNESEIRNLHSRVTSSVYTKIIIKNFTELVLAV